jgi:hypothetical protein
MANSLILLARLEGFGPPTCGLEVRCSIQLSYRRAGAYALSDADKTEPKRPRERIKRLF